MAKLLAGVNYDPAAAVTKATTAGQVMTAMDTTNLRLAFTVPASGRVMVRMAGQVHGTSSSALPQIMFGVLESTTVKGRCAPMVGGGNIAATSIIKHEAAFLVTGLTPSASLTWDAAWAVETGVASTGVKYGGANDTTVNNAFGGFQYEIWDVTT
jgi:hypothetical protein